MYGVERSNLFGSGSENHGRLFPGWYSWLGAWLEAASCRSADPHAGLCGRQVFGVGDPVRMGAQVVSGIGFLGAGTIMVTKHSQIRGLTTAAGLWATAAVGLATGIGFYEAAGMGTLVMVLTLTVLSVLDSKMHKKTRCFEVYVELDPSVSLGIFLDCVRSKGIVIEDVQMEPSRDPESGSRRFMLVVITHRRIGASELMVQLQEAAPDVRMEIF